MEYLKKVALLIKWHYKMVDGLRPDDGPVMTCVLNLVFHACEVGVIWFVVEFFGRDVVISGLVGG